MSQKLQVESLSSVKKEMRVKHRSLMMKKFIRNKLALSGAIIMTIIVLSAIFLPLFISTSPYDIDTINRLQAPSSDHFFGTDNYGRDLFSRVIYGARVSLLVGFAVA
ncbi:ABC transporter permease, partial [Butyricicoccus sp. 1XD8-22]